ncbi:MAG: lipopolysaccharide assembly protein LapA domain-containing protein [Limosilactobacillus sp.]|uniref:lipopolysaccharide assembly protein LapA domain-containing protein n=1 Tax=Limosilactobacillus sp. TaxID=2773925 RepID=UPI0026FA6EBD|nr:lipopolysaccharide assembly protein LapA domain-containing protein [Limosilactobacillus sp.]
MRKQSNIIIAFILLLFIAIFTVGNTAPVKVNLLLFKFRIPLVLLMLLCLLIGAIVIYINSLSSHVKMEKELNQLRAVRKDSKQIERLEARNKQLLQENATLTSEVERLKKNAIKQGTDPFNG